MLQWEKAKIMTVLSMKYEIHYCFHVEKQYYAGADPGFQVRGDALKKNAPSEGRRENFWGISCEKSRFYAKKIIFFSILAAPPMDPPLLWTFNLEQNDIVRRYIVFRTIQAITKPTVNC